VSLYAKGDILVASWNFSETPNELSAGKLGNQIPDFRALLPRIVERSTSNALWFQASDTPNLSRAFCFAAWVRQDQTRAVAKADGSEEKSMDLLWTLAVILLILWLLGLVTSYTLGGFIHILLVVAIIVVLIRVIQGRRAI
jgi:hypothetical protein